MTELVSAILAQHNLRQLNANQFETDECTSTNDLVHALAEAGYPQGTLVRANFQTQGRGRHGSSWFSSPQQLQFSLLIKPPKLTDDLPLLNVIGAYAVLKLLYQLYRLPILMKWPNDLLLNSRKICGVMSEMRTRAGNSPHIVMGCGVNLNVEADEFPLELRASATSVFMETGKETDPDNFLNEWLKLFFTLYDRYTASSI